MNKSITIISILLVLVSGIIGLFFHIINEEYKCIISLIVMIIFMLLPTVLLINNKILNELK